MTITAHAPADRADVAAVIELSDERDRWQRRCLARWREGWRACWPVAYEAGYAAAEASMAAHWHAVAEPVARGGPSYAEVERRRWQVRGEERTRQTFGQPHPADFLGRERRDDSRELVTLSRSAYGRLRGLVAAVLDAKPGERNNVLFWTACRAAELVAAGQVDEAAAAAALTMAGKSAGLGPGEVTATIASGMKGGERVTASEKSSHEADRIVRAAGVQAPHDPLPKEPKTELGYARRLIHVYSDRLRYVPAWKQWLAWDGQRWGHDSTGQAARWMKSIARLVTSDALRIKDDKERQSALNAARRGESSAGVSGALTLAGTEPEVVVTPDNLDADPYLLNCANGTLDLRTGELRGHDPADLITKLAWGAYDQEASGREFAQFLACVQPDESMRSYLSRLAGHGLVGEVVEHVLQIHHGEGANGKSTFTTVVSAALGDYAAPADPELLTARTFDAHPTGVADLFGLRIAVLHEADKGRRLAEGTVKRLTGGDRVKARRMREDFWSFEPSHTFVMLTNHKPVITGTDEGIWRRVRLVPWAVVIPARDRDEGLGDKLALELDFVLTWLVAGCLEWRKRGLDDPELVTKATADYRGESDAVGRFLAEMCVQGPDCRIRSAELFKTWEKWSAGETEDPLTQTAFSNELTSRGFDKKRTEHGAVWQAIGIKADDAVSDE